MDINEAQGVLRHYLTSFRAERYEDLTRLIDQHPGVAVVPGPSGVNYQVEVQVFWDAGARKPGNLRVRGAIDAGGWRALMPLVEDFIMAPDGSFVGE